MPERKTSTKTATRGAKARPLPTVRVTPEKRWRMIAEEAYLRAEKRGFAPGAELQDWLEAEAEVERQLTAR